MKPNENPVPYQSALYIPFRFFILLLLQGKAGPAPDERNRRGLQRERLLQGHQQDTATQAVLLDGARLQDAGRGRAALPGCERGQGKRGWVWGCVGGRGMGGSVGGGMNGFVS